MELFIHTWVVIEQEEGLNRPRRVARLVEPNPAIHVKAPPNEQRLSAQLPTVLNSLREHEYPLASPLIECQGLGL